MPNITKTTLSGQFVNPVTEWCLQAFANASLFAPQFFSIPGAYIQPEMNRPTIKDLSKYIKRSYTKGESVKIPQIALYTVYDKSENVEVTDQSISISYATVTITDHKYISIFEEDASKPFQNFDVWKEATQASMISLARGFENSIVDLGATFSNGTGTTAADTLTISQFAKVGAYYSNAEIPVTKVWSIVTPDQYAYLKVNGMDEYQITGDSSNKTLNSMKLGQTPHGVNVFQSPHVGTTSSASNSFAFTENAIAAVFAISPEVKTYEDGRKIGKRHYSNYMCGYAILRDAEGYKMPYDPTPAI
jgi:hypothetical protein